MWEGVDDGEGGLTVRCKGGRFMKRKLRKPAW